MGVSIIVGGQWGSEGKGKTTYYFTKKLKASSVVRVGGPNSGHTIIDDGGNKRVFQMLPVSAALKKVACVLPAGTYIDLNILEREIEESGIPESLVKINPNAMILTNNFKSSEEKEDLNRKIGSTESGTGAAVIARISRNSKVTLAKDEKVLEKYLCDTTKFLRKELDQNKEIIIEGTQGFGLSLLHSPEYPFATSRDTTAAGFLSETGLSPLDVKNIIMVLRAFPIRVAGNSGPLPKEITWDTVGSIAGSIKKIEEYTTVTKRVRRVAEFDATIVKKAIEFNKPNIVVLNHCDYFDSKIYNQKYLSQNAEDRVKEIEKIVGAVNYIGTGERMLLKR